MHYPLWYAQATWYEHREHGKYPAPGGFNDQDARLVIDDWGVINMRFNHMEDEDREPDVNPHAPPIDDLFGR